MRINEVISSGLDVDADMLLGRNTHQLFNEIISVSRSITYQKSISRLTGNTDGLKENIQLLEELLGDFKDNIDRRVTGLIFSAEYINDHEKQQRLLKAAKDMKAAVSRSSNKSKKDPK